MVCPDQEPYQGNRHRRDSHPLVAKERFAGEGRQQFTDDTQARQYEDINRRVGVEPEQVLEEQHVAALAWIEEILSKDAVE